MPASRLDGSQPTRGWIRSSVLTEASGAPSHRKLLLPLLPNSTEPPPSSAAEHEKRRKAKADVEKEGGKTTSQAEEQQLGAEREAQSTEIHRQDDVRPEQAAGERRKLRWGLTPRETEMVGMGSIPPVMLHIRFAMAGPDLHYFATRIIGKPLGRCVVWQDAAWPRG